MYHQSVILQVEVPYMSQLWIFSENLVSLTLFLNLAFYQSHQGRMFYLKGNEKQILGPYPRLLSNQESMDSPIEGSKRSYYFKICTDDSKVTSLQVDSWGSLI